MVEDTTVCDMANISAKMNNMSCGECTRSPGENMDVIQSVENDDGDSPVVECTKSEHSDSKDVRNKSVSHIQELKTLVPKESARIQSMRAVSALRMQCSVGGRVVEAVLDSGAEITILSESMAKELSLVPEVLSLEEGSAITVNTAGEGSTFSAKKVGPVEIGFGDFFFSTRIFIGPIGDSMLIGVDILTALRAQIDFGRCELRWPGGHSLPLFHEQGRPPENTKTDVEMKPLFNQGVIEQKSGGSHLSRAVSSEVYLCRRINIPPGSHVIAKVNLNLKQNLNSEFMWFEPGNRVTASMANTVHKASKISHLSFVNPGSTSINLKKHTFLGVMHSLDREEIAEKVEVNDSLDSVSVRQVELQSEELPERLQTLFEDGCTNLTSVDEQNRLKKLLIKYQDCFASHEFDMGNFSAVKHRIDTGENEPVALPLRRCPIHFAQEEKDHLDEMLKHNIIRPSQSEWAAAPVLLRKKNNKIRYCLDFRRLNSVTKKDVFPLPNMGECIDSLDGNQWFSKMDANSAYYQIEIDEADRAKTAFRTKYGLFEFNRMPFGLVNAPSTFSRAVGLVMAGLTWEIVLAYLDDLLILGRSTEEHFDNLETVLMRFRQFGLKLKPSKCEFFKKSVEFLGRLVSCDGTTLTDHSKDTIREWTVPDSTKSLQRLLGMANFNRDYIRDYAVVTEPLYKVLRARKFFWNSPQQEAFENLKKLLVSPAILAIPSPGRQFILDTDSSDYASGAVLLQKDQEGKERVIAYGSFSLTRAQRRYCTTKKELLAIVRFCHHWRHYILGVEVICRSDHKALSWLTNFRNIQGQLARWLEELSRYNLVIEYKPGRELAHADALSRLNSDTCPVQIDVSDLPCGGCSVCQRLHNKWKQWFQRVDYVEELSEKTVNQISVSQRSGQDELVVSGMSILVRRISVVSDREMEVVLGPSELVRSQQRSDPNFAFIIAWLENGIVPDEAMVKLAGVEPRFYWNFRHFFFLVDHILYMKGAEDRDVLVVPTSMREEVLRLCHDVASAAHQGQGRTKERIKQSFFWYKMATDVKQYVAGCHVCNKNKASNRKNKFPLVQNHAGLPLEKVHVDFIGPLPESARGNRHILVLIDQFTKWIEVVPLPDQTASVTARAVVDNFFSRFGSAAQMVTDQGTNFESALFKQLCRLLGIHKSRTTSWRPSANGQVERHNRTLKNAIRCYVSKYQLDWDVNLPLIASAIRASVNSSTGYTPNRLMLGREVSIPMDIMYPDHRDKQFHDDFIVQLQKGLQEAHDCARKTLQTKLKRAKKFYDIGAKVIQFRSGDVVYYLDNTRKNKLDSIWIGPCLIIHQVSPYIFDILINNRTQKRVNHDHIKLCTDRMVPTWIERRKQIIAKQMEVIHCICKLPDDGRLMLQCNECLEWYHHHCMGLNQSEARKLKSFVCTECSKKHM